jgi:hypothetical protein
MWISCRGFGVYAILLIVLMSARPARLLAQHDVEPDTTSLATFCGRDRAALARGVSGDEYMRVLRSIQSCGRMAGEALAQQWTMPPSDSAAVMLLSAVSANVRDRRIFQAARDVVQSGGATTVVRLAAIATLVAYADSTVRLAYLPPPESATSTAPATFGHPLSLFSLPPTGSPLPQSVRSDVIAILGQVGTADPNERVRSVAAYVAKRMKGGVY